MDKETLLQKASSASFKKTNGLVLRTINILRERYNKLDVVQDVLEDSGTDISSFIDSVNFLSMEGYIQLRKIDGHEIADIADTSYKDLEAKVTGKGVRLLAGNISDGMIEV